MKLLKFVKYDYQKHFSWLFEHMTDPEEQKWFLTYTAENSVREFEGWLEDRLKHYYTEFFVIEDHGQTAGFVYAYEYHIRDGHCKIGVYIAPELRNSGMGAVAGLQMMRHVFTYYPLRRINCDVYEYNIQSLNSLLQAGFEKMGLWKEYRYYKGKYYDLILLTMTRERYIEKYEKFFPE